MAIYKALMILVLVFVYQSSASAGTVISNHTYTGPLRIEGINPPPNDTTYDWWAHIMKTGNGYKMWWVRGINFDKILYAESRDGMSFAKPKMVLTPAESKWEIQHVGHPTVVLHPNGKYYMFYEAPTDDEWTASPDSNIFLATSTDGIRWDKYPLNCDPRPVIRGYNQKQKHYGVGLPSVYFRDGKFVLYYVDDCEGHGNKMRRAESVDGIHWGPKAGQDEPDPRKHPVVMTGNVGDVRYCPELDRCILAFCINGRILGEPDENYHHEVYLAVSLDSEGKQWAASPPKIWDLAGKRCDVTGPCDPDDNLRLRFFPTIVCDELGHVDYKNLQVTYTKGRLAPIDQDWKAQWPTWDLYRINVKLEK